MLDPRRRPRRRPPADLARFADLRRLLRWLNLTLVHHGPWPLLLLLAGAPDATVAATPGPWFAARVAAPLAAAALALVYLRGWFGAGHPGEPPPVGTARMAPGRVPLAPLVVGLAVAVAAGRLAAGPVAPVARLLLFGAADVAAFHLVHFGVVARSFPPAAAGRAAVLLFGASWAVRAVLLAAFGGSGASLVLAGVSGLIVGLAIGGGAWWLGRRAGNARLPAVGHWLVVYLVAGFAGPA